MKACELIKKYNMSKHEENGRFIELNQPGQSETSGYIYYYISPGEKTSFHEIDSDEFWSFNAGSSAEIWILDKEKNLSIRKIGTSKDCDQTVLITKGCIFAARNLNEDDGTFVTCITVPRFSYDGFKLYNKNEMLEKYPCLTEFYQE